MKVLIPDLTMFFGTVIKMCIRDREATGGGSLESSRPVELRKKKQ